MRFYFNVVVNYILSFSVVVLWTIRLLLQVRKGYDNHNCHNKPQTGNGAGVWMTSYPEEMGWEFGRFWKRFSWVSTMVQRSWCLTIVLRSWGPTMVLRSWCPTIVLRSWGPDHAVEKLGPTMVWRSWDPTMMFRIWGPTLVLRSWVPTMNLKVDIGPWRQTVEFSVVAAAIKLFGS